MGRKDHSHQTAPSCEVMIHPFIQHLLSTYYVPVCQALRGGEGRAQTKSLPLQLKRKYPCRWSFLKQTTYLLHPIYHKVKSYFRDGFY